MLENLASERVPSWNRIISWISDLATLRNLPAEYKTRKTDTIALVLYLY